MLSLMEYTIHRHLMHKVAFAKFLENRYLVDTFRDHAIVHHARCYAVFDEESGPCASINIRVKPLTTLTVTALPCLLVFLIDPTTALVLFTGAVLNGAVWSEIHEEMHRPRGAWFSKLRSYRYLKRRHYLHHRYPNTNFNTLFPIWDWILGTASVETEDDRLAMRAESWRVRRTNCSSRNAVRKRRRSQR
jgi:sterol desaturase/sphingolipid hydroxylase (fatty acid hydroxylase superfamily)